MADGGPNNDMPDTIFGAGSIEADFHPTQAEAPQGYCFKRGINPVPDLCLRRVGFRGDRSKLTASTRRA